MNKLQKPKSNQSNFVSHHVQQVIGLTTGLVYVTSVFGTGKLNVALSNQRISFKPPIVTQSIARFAIAALNSGRSPHSENIVTKPFFIKALLNQNSHQSPIFIKQPHHKVIPVKKRTVNLTDRRAQPTRRQVYKKFKTKFPLLTACSP